jgi:hypothetical protein
LQNPDAEMVASGYEHELVILVEVALLASVVYCSHCAADAVMSLLPWILQGQKKKNASMAAQLG